MTAGGDGDMRQDPVSSGAERTRSYYDRVATEYYERHQWPIQRFTTRFDEKWIYRSVDPRSRVLVVGAGAGREICVLRRLGCRITATDFSVEMVKVGQTYFPHSDDTLTWLVADAHNLVGFRQDFDVVISLGAVNFFAEPAQAVSEMAACARPGGVLLVSGINSDHSTERDLPVSDSVIRHRLSSGDVEGWLADSGARVVWSRSHRLWVDRLPRHWNRPLRQGSHFGWLLLEGLILLERLLCEFYSGSAGKFFMVKAERPEE